MVTDISVNLWAVLVSGVIYMAVGSLWYSPLLFGKPWMHYMGIKQEDMGKMKNSVVKAYLGSFIASLVTSYVLAHFVAYTDAITFAEGMQTAFWIWLGFVITFGMNAYFYEHKALGLVAINRGYDLVVLLLTGGLLAVWQ